MDEMKVEGAKTASNSDPKDEFVRYFKHTGTFDAVQKATVLLYRMPVKPASSVEFFAEYFENGAQTLLRISMLQAELCYKRNLLETRLDNIRLTKERIEDLQNTLETTNETPGMEPK